MNIFANSRLYNVSSCIAALVHAVFKTTCFVEKHVALNRVRAETRYPHKPHLTCRKAVLHSLNELCIISMFFCLSITECVCFWARACLCVFIPLRGRGLLMNSQTRLPLPSRLAASCPKPQACPLSLPVALTVCQR